MENIRRWLQTLALVGLAVAALFYVVTGSVPRAHADVTPTCEMIDSQKFVAWDAEKDVLAKATTFLGTVGADRRVVVIPYGRTLQGSGGTLSVVCAF